MKLARAKISKNQSGAVSLITVILLMFVFLVVTLGFLRLAINEQRQSSDSDLNSRAFYAAESGLEDAARILNIFNADGNLTAAELENLDGEGCGLASVDGTPEPVLSEDLDTEITCQIIDIDPGDFVASLGMDESVLVPLIPADGESPDEVDNIKIEWHESAVEGTAVARSALNTNLPTASCWNDNESINEADCNGGNPYAALLKVDLIRHSSSGAIERNPNNAGGISSKIAYLNPIDIAGISEVTDANFRNLNANGVAQLSQSADCEGSQTYFCQLTITDVPDGVKYLRITPIYRGSNIRVTMLSQGGDPFSFSGSQAKIDVTARAGAVLRRVEARMALTSRDLLPNDGVTTSEQLCKLVTIVSPNSAFDDCPNTEHPIDT